MKSSSTSRISHLASRISHLASRISKGVLASFLLAMLATSGKAQFNNNSNNSGRLPGASGLTAEYFSDQGSFTSRIDSAPNTSLVLPVGMDASQGYTVVWSGYLKVATTGTYTVTIDLGYSTSQQSSVAVNGTLVTLYNTYPNTLANYQTSITLTAGQNYPLVVRAQLFGTGAWAPRAFLTQSGTNTTLTTNNFLTAVIPGTPVDNVSYVAPDGATSTWTISDTPASINVYKYTVGTVSGIYSSPFTNVAPTVTTYTDLTGQEGVDTEYDLKEVYNNSVTGGQTLGPAIGTDTQMPYQIMNNPVNTGSGKVTLFFSAPPNTVNFRIYEDSVAGTPAHVVATGPVSQFQDTRYGQTNSYMYSMNGLTVGNTEYYTIQALDANGIVLHTSEQIDWITGASGIPWDSSDASAIGQSIYSTLTNATGVGNVDYLDCLGPNMVMFSVKSGTSTTWQKYEPGSQDYQAVSQSFVTKPGLNKNSFSTSTTAQNNPVFGSAAGPYDQYKTTLGFSAISSPLFVPDRVSGSNFQRNSTKAGPDTFNFYEGGEFMNSSGHSGAVDAGIVWDVSPTNKSVSNNFWSPILNISSTEDWTFTDNGTTVKTTSPPSHRQVNGFERIYFPQNSGSFSLQMGFIFGMGGFSPGSRGFLALSINGYSGFQLCDRNGNLEAGSKILLTAYDGTSRNTKILDLVQSSVKVCTSVAQDTSKELTNYLFQVPFVADGTFMNNWVWGDNQELTPIQIGKYGTLQNLQSWDNYNFPGGAFWFVSPSFGTNGIIQPGSFTFPMPFFYLPGNINIGS